MTKLQQIRRDAGAVLRDVPFGELCLKLIDEIDRHSKDTSLWTYSVMSRWLGTESTDPNLQSCLSLLSTSSTLHLLDAHFMFFDPTLDDDIGEKIEADVMREAFRSGYLAHPHTGKKVKHFQSSLVPYFTLAGKPLSKNPD